MADLITIKTRGELVREIIDYISSRYPTADLSPGLVMRDLLVEGPMDYLANTSVIASLIGQVLDLNSLAELVGNVSTRLTFARAFNVDPIEFDNTLKNIIELYASNYNISRKLGTKSRGIITFYSVTEPSSSLVVPAGTEVKIPNTQIVFKTLKTVTMPTLALQTTTNPLLYDTLNNRYYVNVVADCLSTGGIGNVPANSIIEYSGSPVVGLQPVNSLAFVGGTDPETDAELVVRLKNAYTGNFKGTAPSIVSTVLSFDFIKDVAIAYLYNDINKVRSGMNTVDLFIQGGKLISNTSTVTITENPYFFALANAYTTQLNVLQGTTDTPTAYTYPSFTHQLSYGDNGESFISFLTVGSPHFVVTELLVDYAPTGIKTATLYLQTFYKADGTVDTTRSTIGTFPDFVAGSVLSATGRVKVFRILGDVSIDDTLNWSYTAPSTGVQGLTRIADVYAADFPTLRYEVQILPKVNDVMTIDSLYNSAISEVQSYVANPANLFVGQDIMCYPATAVQIVADIKIQVDTSYQSIPDLEAAAYSKIVELLGNTGLGQELNQTFYISELLKIPGIVDVERPFSVFTRNYDTRMGSTDIVLSPKEYPIVADIADVVVHGQYEPLGR